MHYPFRTQWCIILAAFTVVTALHARTCCAQQMYLAAQPDTAKKCAICHFQWVYPFYKENRDGDLARRPPAEVVAESDMCFSCHDGSVSDARDFVYSGTGHHTGALPSNTVSIPDGFPLDERGAMTCATCHTPHALPSETGQEIDVFLRSPNADSELCRRCHRSYDAGPEGGAHPIGVTAPQGALRATAAAGSLYSRDGSGRIICETCHSAHGTRASPQLTLHDAPPEDMQFLCFLCHSDRARNTNNHPLTIPESDMSLPDRWPSGRQMCRAESGRLVCSTCHIPHGAPTDHALLPLGNTRSRMCRSCHKAQISVLETPHDLAQSAPETLNRLGRKPGRTGPCSACHVPHDSTSPFLWARSDPVVPALQNYCLSCHKENGCARSVIAADPSHPAGISVSGTAGGLPLYTDAGHISKSGTIRCMTCHDAHNSAQVPPAPGSGRTCSFLRKPHYPDSSLCAACHDKNFSIVNTPHDMRQHKQPVQKAISSEAGSQGICGFCHDMHGAGRKHFLWAAPFGASVPQQWSGAAERTDLCTSGYCTGCHGDKNISSQELPEFGTHPAAYAPRPLSGLPAGHSRSNACMIVCSTCHNPHQWAPGKHFNATGNAPSGNAANSFLRHNTAASLCAICHGLDALVKYTYFHSSASRAQQKKPFPFEKRPELSE